MTDFSALPILHGVPTVAEITVTLLPHGYAASGPADEQGMARGIAAGADLEAIFAFIRDEFARFPVPDESKAPILEAISATEG